MEERVDVLCPHCGESVAAWVEPAGGPCEYVEDCFVCCRPIRLRVTSERDGTPRVDARAD